MKVTNKRLAASTVPTRSARRMRRGKRRRTRVRLLALFGVLALSLAACAGVGRGDDGLFYLTLTSAELQRDLAAGFPLRKCSMTIACAEFSNPQLTMREDADRLFFDSELVVDVLSLQFPGRVSLSGLPRYDAERAGFYLGDVQIEQITVDGVPPDVTRRLHKDGGKLLQPMFDGHPIYRIDRNSLRGSLLRRTLRDVRVVNGQLRASFALSEAH